VSSVERSVIRVEGGTSMVDSDTVAVERPVEIRLSGTPISVIMSSPGKEPELALGFALTEGIVLGPHEVAAVEPVGEGDRWELILSEGVTVDPEQFRRNAYTTSSCGVCGKASIDAVRIAARHMPSGPAIESETLLGMAGELRAHQETFDATGGVHAAGIFRPDGTLLAIAEDIGRHNAVDKAIGSLARERWPMSGLVLQVSGRVSFEITQKAAVAGIPILAGVSAASSLAVELGEELGMTVIGFSRGDAMVVYCGDERVAASG
jgi:FdhD protein